MPLIVINHHYYRETGNVRGIYPISSSGLIQEVSAIRSAGWRIGDESDILRYVSGDLGLDDHVAVLTFDDGLREQLAAIKKLEKLGAKAICFVPTAPIVDQVVLEVHKLHMIRAHVEDIALANELNRRFDFLKQTFDDELLAQQYRYDDILARRIKYFLNFSIDNYDRRQWISEYFQQLFGSEKIAAQELYMDRSEIKSLARRGLLGSHAHSHFALATLDAQEVDNEIFRACEVLSDISGFKVVGISYPFGGRSAVSEAVFSAAEARGHQYGLTMERGVNFSNGAFCKMKLKRIDTNDLQDWLTQITVSGLEGMQ